MSFTRKLSEANIVPNYGDQVTIGGGGLKTSASKRSAAFLIGARKAAHAKARELGRAMSWGGLCEMRAEQ
jgi:hypothetical protein